MYRSILFIIILFSFISCEKSETVIVPDNTAPPDTTIESYIIENYVHKVYIALLGRDASDSELESAMITLKSNNYSVENRNNVLQQVMDGKDYKEKLFDITRVELLNSLDTSQVSLFIGIYEFTLSDSGQIGEWPYAQYELDRLHVFRNALPELIDGTIDMKDVYYRCINTLFFESINMGYENFVVGAFQNLLNRYPTDSELENSKLMLAGLNGSLFLVPGNSQEDFIDIITNSNSYYEGRVKYLFIKYLFREPTSDEMYTFTKIYKDNDSFEFLHKAIFALDEYAGL